MNSDTTSLVIVALVVGIAIGWFLARTRVSGKVDISFTPPAGGSSSPFSVNVTRLTNLTLKCTCGHVQKFRSSSTGPTESQTFPPGDSYTCPNCGKVHNLAELRKLASGATSSH
jgi:hypothetical protein